jgi:ATP-dependent Clp protease ATP-binding subunit ClpC
VLDDGILTDGLGRKVDFKNTILIMTSNIGTKDIKIDKVFGFGDSTNESDYEKIKSGIDEAVKKVFSPEFLNRIDDLIVFRQLERDSILKIVDIGLNKLKLRLKTQSISIELTKQVREILAQRGYDQKFGARPLRRIIQKYLEDPLSEEILKGTIKENSKIKVRLKKGSDEFIFHEVSKNESQDKDNSEEVIDESKDTKGL